MYDAIVHINFRKTYGLETVVGKLAGQAYHRAVAANPVMTKARQTWLVRTSATQVRLLQP